MARGSTGQMTSSEITEPSNPVGPEGSIFALNVYGLDIRPRLEAISDCWRMPTAGVWPAQSSSNPREVLGSQGLTAP